MTVCHWFNMLDRCHLHQSESTISDVRCSQNRQTDVMATKFSPVKCQFFFSSFHIFNTPFFPTWRRGKNIWLQAHWFHVKIMLSESVQTKSSDVGSDGGWKQKANRQTKSKQHWPLAGNFLTFESLSRDNVVSDTHTRSPARCEPNILWGPRVLECKGRVEAGRVRLHYPQRARVNSHNQCCPITLRSLPPSLSL